MKNSILFLTLFMTAVAGLRSELPAQSAMFRVNPQRTGAIQTKGPLKHEKVLWRFETKGMVQSSPVIVGDDLYIGSNDGFLYVLNRHTGIQKWRYEAGGRVSSTPAVFRDRVIFQTSENTVYALDTSRGELIWKFSGGEDLPFSGYYGTTYDYWVSSPLIKSGKVFIGSGDGGVYALNQTDGKVVWRFATQGRVRSSPAFADNRVFAGSFDGYMYALDAESGKPLWKFKTLGNEYFQVGEIQSSPAVADGKVIFGSRDYNVYAVDATSGEEIWHSTHENSWVITSPAVADGKVFVGSSDGMFVQALNLKNGEELWRARMQANVFASPLFAGGRVYAADWAGIVLAFDPDSGKAAAIMLVDSRINSSPVASEGIIYFGCEGGSVVAVSGPTGETAR